MNKSAMFSVELFSKHLRPGPSSVELQVQCNTVYMSKPVQSLDTALLFTF